MGQKEKLAAIKWHLNFSLPAKAAFGSVSWRPRGKMPLYMAYYPESLWRDPLVRDLYARWIRGNQINNNGDGSRFISLLLNARKVVEDGVEGHFAELGVWKGNSAAVLAEIGRRNQRETFLFDTFEGFDCRDIRGLDEMRRKGQFKDTSIDYVKETVGCEKSVHYIKGFFPQSIPDELKDFKFSLVHIDCDLHDPMKAALEFFYPRMSRGALAIMHDYHSGSWPGATEAINEFCAATGESLIIVPDKSGTAMFRKSFLS
jgi:hypothetical protein